MLHQMSGLSLKSPLRLFTALVFHLLLLHSCKGQNQLIGSSQPIVATVGDDIILPCHLKPAVDVTEDTLEWTRPDLNPRYVHIWYIGVELVNTQHPSYKGRTSLITEELKHGNISLKLSKVKVSDEGTYKCHIPFTNNQSLVELVVGAVPSHVPTIAKMNSSNGRVVLQCESKGWYPEPEVFWLDGERKLLSAGPTETVRGPDDLYTVISRVTVEKKHSNNFTCRVKQNHTNQTRETHLIVPDEFFMFQSDSGVSINIGLAVCILLIFAVVVLVWKQNIMNKMRSCMDKTKRAESNGTKMQVAEAAERKSLMKTQRVSTNNKENKCQQLQQQRREEVGNKVENVKIKTQHDELQRLRSELETKKKKELEERQNSQSFFSRLFSTNEQLEQAKKEVETLEKKLQDEIDMKLNQFNELLELEKNMDQEPENMDQEPENIHQEVENMDQEPENMDQEPENVDEENMKIKTQHDELQRLRSELETKKKELDESQNSQSFFSRKRKKNEQLEQLKEVETLEKKLKTKQDEFDMKTKQLEESQNSYKRFSRKRKKNEQLEQVEEVETLEKKLKTEFDNIKQQRQQHKGKR